MNHKETKSIFIVCAILALVSLFWFKGNNYIAGGDSFIPMFPWKILNSYLTLWTDRFFLGMPSVTQTNSIFPYLGFWSFAKMLGLSLLNIEKIWLFLIIFFSGYSFYFFLNCFTPKLNIYSKILAIIFYTINPIVFFSYNLPANNPALVLIFIPLILGLTHKIIESKNKKYIYFLALSSTLLINLGSNIPLLIASIIPLLVYLLYRLVTTPKIFFSKLPSLFLVFIYSTTINLFWIIQFVFTFNKNSIQAVQSTDWLIWTSVNATIPNILRFLGSWSFNDKAYESFYVTYHQIYQTNLYYIISLIFIFVILISALNYFINKKTYLPFFLILFLLALGLAKGPNEPFGGIYIWLYNHTTIFSMFREPWTKFAPIFLVSGSVLFAYGIEYIIYFINKIYYHTKIFNLLVLLMFLTIFSSIIIYDKPFIDGKIIPSDRGKLPGAIIKIPDYWNQTVNYINNNNDISTLIQFPSNPFYQIHLFWPGDGYYGVDPSIDSITKPIISLDPGGRYFAPNNSKEIISSIYKKISSEDQYLNLSKISSILRISHLLIRNDLDWQQVGSKDGKNPKEILEYLKNKDINSVASFGKINPYENLKDEFFQQSILPNNNWLTEVPATQIYSITNTTRPLIYPSSNLTLTDANNNQFADVVSLPFVNGENFVFSKQNITNDVLTKFANEIVTLIDKESYIFKDGNYISNFSLPKKGEYEIYLNIDKNVSDNSYITTEVDQKAFSDNINNLNSGWQNIGTTTLDGLNGEISIINDKNVIKKSNQIVNGNFNNKINNWQLIDCGLSLSKKSDYNYFQLNENNNNFMRIVANSHIACARQKILNITKGSLYQLSYEYRNVVGSNPKTTIEFLDNGEQSAGIQELDNEKRSDWVKKDVVFEAKTDGIMLYFYANASNDKTINDYKNITLIELPQTKIKQIALINKADSNINDVLDNKLPTISIDKYNPWLLSYKIHVSNATTPFIINFMQSYDKAWRIKNINNDHFVSNGYANGWIIDKNGDYDLEIYYSPQKIFLFLQVISLLLVVILIYQLIKKSINKNYYDIHQYD